MMSGLTCMLLVAASAACVLAIPSSLLTDVKQAEMSRARLTNKVKRAQEVIMFGNQQNHGGDGRNGFSLPRTEKRGVEVEDNVLTDTATEQPRAMYSAETEEVMEEPKVMALYDKNFRQNMGEPEYPTRLQNAVLKSEYYADPAALTDLRYYDLDERRKREIFRTQSKRSSRGFNTPRYKRDLDLDPEELLALLSYWEGEMNRNKLQQSRNMYNQYNTVDNDDMEMLDNTDGGNDPSEDDESRQDGWLEGPIAIPSRHISLGGAQPWGRQRFSTDDRRKRFMVSKRRNQDNDMYTLAHLLNSPPREQAPVFRRYAL